MTAGPPATGALDRDVHDEDGPVLFSSVYLAALMFRFGFSLRRLDAAARCRPGPLVAVNAPGTGTADLGARRPGLGADDLRLVGIALVRWYDQSGEGRD